MPNSSTSTRASRTGRSAARRVERADDYLAAAESADLTVLLQPHREIDLGELADRARALFDTRGKSADHPRVVKL